MNDKIKNLWNNNRLVFFLLIPFIALFFLRNILIDMLVSSGNKVVSDTSKKSDELKQESVVADTKANQIIEDADKARKDQPKVGQDWDK